MVVDGASHAAIRPRLRAAIEAARRLRRHDRAAPRARRRPTAPGGSRAAGVPGAGVVHAPGRPLAARVPGAARRGQHPRRHPRPGAVGRDHAPARAALRRRRRHPLQRHRRARRTPSASASTSPRASARSSPSRSARPPTSTGSGPSSPTSTRPTCSRPSASSSTSSAPTPLIGFAGAPFTVASYLIEGRPSRTYGLHQGADARRARPVATSCSTASPTWPSPRCSPRSRPGPAPSSCSTRGRARCAPDVYDDARAARQRQGVRRARGHRRAPHPLRGRHRRAARPSWATPAPTWWASTGGSRSTSPAPGCPARPCRATSTPPCCLAPWDVVAERTRDVLRRNGGRPGHIFNLGHGVLPELDPGVLAQVVDLVHEEGRSMPDGAARTAGRGGDGLRHAGLARRHRGVLHPHPPRERADPGAARRPHRPLRRHRRHLAAGRAHRGAAGRARSAPSTSGRPGGASVVLGQKHAAPFIEDAVGRPADDGVEPRSSGSCWPRTSRGPRSASTRSASPPRPRSHGLPVGRDRQLAPRARLPRLPHHGGARRARRAARAHEGAVHRPLAAGAGPRRRPVPRPAPGLRGRGRRGRRARPLGRLVAVLAVGRPHPGAVAGPGHPRGHPRAGRHRAADGVLVCPQGFVSDHLEVVYDLDIEAARLADEVGLAFARTRVLNDDPRSSARWPTGCSGRGAGMTARSSSSAAASAGLVAARDLVLGRGDGHPRRAGRPRRQAAHHRLRRGHPRRGRRRLPGPRARGRRPVPRARARGRPRVAGRPPGLRVEPRRAPPAPRGPGARRAHRPRRAGGVRDHVPRGCAARPPTTSRRRSLAPPGDVTIGALMRARLGDEVTRPAGRPARRRHQRRRHRSPQPRRHRPPARRRRPQRRALAHRGVPRRSEPPWPTRRRRCSSPRVAAWGRWLSPCSTTRCGWAARS